VLVVLCDLRKTNGGLKVKYKMLYCYFLALRIIYQLPAFIPYPFLMLAEIDLYEEKEKFINFVAFYQWIYICAILVLVSSHPFPFFNIISVLMFLLFMLCSLFLTGIAGITIGVGFISLKQYFTKRKEIADVRKIEKG